MAYEQPDLQGNRPVPPDQRSNQISPRLVDRDGFIIPSMWTSARATQSIIGTCRHCGGDLRPEKEDPLYVSQTRRDYEAWCAACKTPTVFPNGRTGRWDDTQKRGRRRPLPKGEKGISTNVPAYLQDGE